MTLLTAPSAENKAYSAEHLMKLRREKIRDRRLREGSLISGRNMNSGKNYNIIELYPDSIGIAL